MQLAIGIDLGGTKIEVVAIDAGGARADPRAAAPTPRDDYDGTLDTIRAMVLEVEDELGATGTRRHRHPGRDLAAPPA